MDESLRLMDESLRFNGCSRIEFGQFIIDGPFDLVAILLKLPNAGRQQVCGHFAFVHFVPEDPFGGINILQFQLARVLCLQFTDHLLSTVL